MFTPMNHQLIISEQATKILKKLGYVYIYGQPRSGKTLTAILVAENCNIKNVMVLTKKAAIPGWAKFISADLKHNYTIINYEQLGKLVGSNIKLNYNPQDYQLVIVDESHNFGAFPKPTLRYKLLRAFCKDLPHIHLSGTPIIESPCGIYHQMHISKFSPFSGISNFYRFHDKYGVKESIYVRGQPIIQYKGYKPELLDYIETFTLYMSQEDAGITIKAEDKIHYIELSDDVKAMYNTFIQKKLIENEEINYALDTPMKLRIMLHQLEGGVLKIENKPYIIHNNKIDYIKANFGDSDDIGIMSHFTAEQDYLKANFKHAQIFSSNAHAEGVDLSYLKHFIIYSSDYSGARFVQRRDRIINMNGSNTTIVHHLIVKKAISEQIYNTVSKKLDFNNTTFKSQLL